MVNSKLFIKIIPLAQIIPRSLWLAHDGFSVAFNKKQRPLQSGDLGFEEFGVSEGLPLVPNTFTNLKFTINWETESGESGINLNYVIDEDTVKIHHLYGTSEAFWAEESFIWEESGHNTISSTTTNADGRVVVGSLTFQDADSGTFELKFYESENGQLVYKESGIGTFTIEEYSVAELPTTKGWMWFDLPMGLFEY